MPSMEFRVSSFLGAHKSSLRSPDLTLRNLSNLYEELDEKDRDRFWELLVSAYEREPFLGGTGAHYGISIPSVVLHAIIMFGPVAHFLPRILDHLLSLEPERMEEWTKVVSPVLQYNLYHSAGRFDDTTLNLIQGFRGRLRELVEQGQALPPQLLAAAKDLERVVADVKLQKLENTTWGGEKLAAKGTKKMRGISNSLDTSTAITGGRNAWLEIKGEYGVSKRMLGKRIVFIKDEFKRGVIFRDIEQAYLLANHGFYKPAVILAGGVIEELLRLYLKHKSVASESNNLDSYIKACEKQGFIKGAIHNLADSVRQFRNVVHMEREGSPKQSISKANAKGAVSSIFTIASGLAT